ncbi:Trafficking protein particle complex II-specific subunit 130 [Galdieria sulphuraria]|nr:Trafficking protein particle complex II-specific subunit 130 [Galdieria sulphuraria]
MEGISRGLPVKVVDEYKIWDRLRVESSLPLYQLSWKDYSNDVAQLIQVTELLATFTLDRVADLDSYREKQRMRLHVFAEACREKSVEYLIVYSPPSTAPLAAALSTTNSNVSSLSLRMFSEEDPAQKARRKVFERLKTELNVIKGRETVVKLEQGGTVPAFFVHRLRECIVSAIEQRIKGYRKEVDKYLQSKSVPGWNFQKFVALEESLAFVYYQAGHLESSLKCYQIAQEVFQTNKIGIFRQASTKVSSARQVLYYGCEEIRNLLCQSHLGELEVSSYIFSRQFSLLYSLRMFEDIPKLVFNYIANIYQRTKHVTEETENFFIQAWIFCCCSVLRDSSYVPRNSNVDESEENADMQHSFPVYFSEDFIAKLIFMQLLCFSNFLRSKFDKISIEFPCVYLDVKKVFLDSLTQITVDDRILKEDETLSQHLESLENGCAEFIGLCRTLTELLDKVGRQRLVSEMRGYYGITLATIGRLEEARQVLETECNLLSSEHWNLILFCRLSWLARTEKDLGLSSKYLSSCLNILHNLCELQRNCSEHIVERVKQEASIWIEEVHEVSKTVPETISFRLDKIFRSCRIVTKLQLDEIFQFDPLSLDISLESELPGGIYIEKCIVFLAEQNEFSKEIDHKRIQLESNDSFYVLPGSNIISVITDSLELCGVLLVESIHLKMHRLSLIWTATDPLDTFFPLFTSLFVHERPPLGRIFLQSCSEIYTNDGKFFVDQDIEVEASHHSSVEGSSILIGFCGHRQDRISLRLPTIEAGDTYRLTASIPIPKENFDFSKAIQTAGETSHYKQTMFLFATLVGKEFLSSGEEKPYQYNTEKEIEVVFPFFIVVVPLYLVLLLFISPPYQFQSYS